ncbi:LysR family transcriptional regulator [Enterobacter roggenkampii]
MRTLKIHELTLVASMAELRSFSRAAERHGVTQATLSKSIAIIESKLGGRLFERDTRPVLLTEFGNVLLPHIENCIKENNNLLEFARLWQGTCTGNVKIFAPMGLQIAIAQLVMPAISKEYPDIKVTIMTQNQSLSDMRKGVVFPDDCDIYISYAPPNNHNLIARKLGRIKFNVYCTDAYFKNHQFNTMDELFQYDFLLQNAIIDHEGLAKIELCNINTKETQKIELNGKYTFDNIITAYECCKAGLGYMFIPEGMVNGADQIYPRLDINHAVYIDVYMIYRYYEKYPSRIRAVLDIITQQWGREADAI